MSMMPKVARFHPSVVCLWMHSATLGSDVCVSVTFLVVWICNAQWSIPLAMASVMLVGVLRECSNALRSLCRVRNSRVR